MGDPFIVGLLYGLWIAAVVVAAYNLGCAVWRVFIRPRCVKDETK